MTALRTPTTAVRSVRRRWLVVVDAGRQWSWSRRTDGRSAGRNRVMEISWSAKDGLIVSTAEVRRYFRPWNELRFADGSAIALLLGRSARTQFADAISRVGPGLT